MGLSVTSLYVWILLLELVNAFWLGLCMISYGKCFILILAHGQQLNYVNLKMESKSLSVHVHISVHHFGRGLFGAGDHFGSLLGLDP